MVSCHKYNLKPSLVQYIYRISYKIAKKANPDKGFAPFENCRYAIRAKMSDISKVFESVEMLRYYQTIKGFDKLDFYEVISMYLQSTDRWFSDNTPYIKTDNITKVRISGSV